MGKVRLIQLGKYFHPVPGGMERHLYDLCSSFKDKFDIHVLVANTRARTVTEVLDGIKVTRMANWGELFSNPMCPTFPFQLSQVDGHPDAIIQLHLPNPMAHLAFLLSNPPGKLIIAWHSDIVRQKRLSKLYDRHLHKLLERADRIVATSPNYIAHSPYLRNYREKCRVVPLGINPEKFRLTPTVESQIEKIRSTYGKRITLFVGRFTYYKGLENLVQAAKQIDGKVILVGDGPLRENLATLIQENNLTEKVIMLHNIEDKDLAAYYYACDVFVLPSNQRSEAFGLVQLEAMICGKPVVSTDLTTGVPWVNVNGKTGLTVPVDHIHKLSEAVNYFLENKEVRNAFGRAGKDRVLKHFTLAKVSAAMAEVYEQVLSVRNPSDKENGPGAVFGKTRTQRSELATQEG